jgi:hypothetical protein
MIQNQIDQLRQELTTWLKKNEDLVLSDGRMKLVFITRKTGVSEPTVWKVLHDDLGMKKVFARWIPSQSKNLSGKKFPTNI